MRKKDETLGDVLLGHARRIADTEGIDAINIRSIAKKAGVATGTVYNYFSNKDEILLALTEEYWKQTLAEMGDAVASDSFLEQLEGIYAFLRERIDRSAGRFMGSLGNVEGAGRQRMASMEANLERALVRRMEQDSLISGDIWDETFTKEQFARFIMTNLLISLKEKNPAIHFFITIVKRTIY